MKEILENVTSGFGVTDALDIIIIAFAVYKILGWIRQTRAEQLVKGLLVLVVIMVLSGFFHLYAVNWILKSTLAVGVLAIAIVFQPELRRGLEHLGRSRFFAGSAGSLDKQEAKAIVGAFLRAIESASYTRTGMLIVIERQTSLSDIIETGTEIDAAISANLLGTIFYEGTPLHDGAVIIRGDRIVAAGCVLPLTTNPNLPAELGTRHRAGIGITEYSDSICIIVSEESGIISMARDGKLERYLEEKNVEKVLLDMYLGNENKNIIREMKKNFTAASREEEDDV